MADATPTPSRCDGPTPGIAVAEAAVDVVVAVVEAAVDVVVAVVAVVEVEVRRP
jgi:hypothetical protein